MRYITNGTYLNIMKEMLEGEVSEEMKPLKQRIARLIDLYEEALEKVKADDNQDEQDFLARRLYNMTAVIIQSLLLIEDASKASDLFAKSANVLVRMAEEEVTGSSAYIKAFTPADLEHFKVVEEEV